MSKIVDWVVPPAGADAESQRDWQWRISMAIVGLYGAIGFLVAAAVGQITGVAGFASAQEVAQAQQLLNDVRLDQIRNRIDAKRVQQCQAMLERNQFAMSAIFQQMQDLVNQHYTIAGYAYRVPPCEELIPYATSAPAAPTPVPQVQPRG